MTVTTTVSPGRSPRAAGRVAKRARSTSPSATAPVWSTATTRSASPSKARPRSAPVRDHRGARARSGWVDPQPRVDVRPVGLDRDRGRRRPRARANTSGAMAAGRAVGAVEHDRSPASAPASERPSEVRGVVARRPSGSVRSAARPSGRSGGRGARVRGPAPGASSSASMAASSASDSFGPRRESSLIPLSSKGLWEAETIAAGRPRAAARRRRRAWGGRRRRPRRRPRRRARPRARPAAAGPTGGCRVRRGTVRAPRRRAAARPSASASSAVQLGVGNAADPVGAEARRMARRRRSPLGVLRRLAGLLEAVLLALLLAGVAGEEAGPLEGGAQLGVEPTRARAMPRRRAPAWPDIPPPSIVASTS